MKPNRITPYAAGWLTLLIDMGVASEAEAREARDRIAREAIAELERRRRRGKKRRG
jgi:hypothetical protein